MAQVRLTGMLRIEPLQREVRCVTARHAYVLGGLNGRMRAQWWHAYRGIGGGSWSSSGSISSGSLLPPCQACCGHAHCEAPAAMLQCHLYVTHPLLASQKRAVKLLTFIRDGRYLSPTLTKSVTAQLVTYNPGLKVTWPDLPACLYQLSSSCFIV